MEDEDEIDTAPVAMKAEKTSRRKVLKIVIPRRRPSVVEKPRQIVYVSADKTFCARCGCFPREDPYEKPKKLNPCQKSPLKLYELAAAVVDQLEFPAAFTWSVQTVAEWMMGPVGLPQYTSCIYKNKIDGRRLLLLEDPSHLAMVNIKNMNHIKRIVQNIHWLYGTEFIKFTRSIGLPPRKPLTHCTFFKSRTGPSWGIRQNWSRTDFLRWMKIIGPKPVHRDHWDLVWYQKPDFPKLMFARIPPASTHEHIPHYRHGKREPCKEYTAPRKFRIKNDIPENRQEIWLEHRPGSPIPSEVELARQRKVLKTKYTPTVPKPCRLDPRRISLTGLSGKDLILARRLMPKKKFLDFEQHHSRNKENKSKIM